MNVPMLYYGPYKEVLPRCRKIVTGLRRSGCWSDLIGSPMAGTASISGLLLVDGPSPLVGGESNFHCYLLHKVLLTAFLDEKLTPAVEEQIFVASLQTSWGTLGLLSEANTMWLRSPSRHRPLLNATLRFWDELYAEGERYSNGSTCGQDLWSLNTNLKFVLANLGVEMSILTAPFPPCGLHSLVAKL